MNIGMQRIHCVCGLTHRLTPTSMAIVIDAFAANELHTVGADGEIIPLCVLTALVNMDVRTVTTKYRGSIKWVVQG